MKYNSLFYIDERSHPLTLYSLFVDLLFIYLIVCHLIWRSRHKFELKYLYNHRELFYLYYYINNDFLIFIKLNTTELPIINYTNSMKIWLI